MNGLYEVTIRILKDNSIDVKRFNNTKTLKQFLHKCKFSTKVKVIGYKCLDPERKIEKILNDTTI